MSVIANTTVISNMIRQGFRSPVLDLTPLLQRGHDKQCT